MSACKQHAVLLGILNFADSLGLMVFVSFGRLVLVPSRVTLIGLLNMFFTVTSISAKATNNGVASKIIEINFLIQSSIFKEVKYILHTFYHITIISEVFAMIL